jgi:transposase-like protein
MLGHGAKLGHKKEQAIAALLSHRNVEEAARSVGISANTLLRWTKDPEFDAACREARRTAFSQSLARLQQASIAAVTTLLKIMTDSNASSSARVRAAEVVLERTAKAIEIEDIDVRVADLERAVGSAKTSHKGYEIVTWPSQKALPGPPTNPGEENGE